MEAKKKQELKKSVTADAGRRRRGDNAIQLRKAQKEEGLAKRRNVKLDDVVNAEHTGQTTSGLVNQNTDINSMLRDIQSSDVSTQLAGIKAFRRILSVEKNPPVQQCIDVGAVTIFVTFLQRGDCPELQFEAAWALTNIASTEHTAIIANFGAIPHLVKLLTSCVPDIREQSAWCLGNVAGDGPELRDLVLTAGALGPLISNIAEPASLSLLRNCTWSLSNFCRGKPQADLSVILPAIHALGML